MKVHEIFRSIQGEGFMTGTPMTFIRLYGCNQSCQGCDTPQSGYQEMTIEEIVACVEDDWACITGGEPTIHDELPVLVNALRERGVKVAIETNGTNVLPRGLSWVCVSPKSQWPDSRILGQAHEVKLVVGSGMYDVDKVLARRPNLRATVSLQPWWDDNYEANLREAIRLCQKYQVRLSLQTHKWIGVR